MAYVIKSSAEYIFELPTVVKNNATPAYWRSLIKRAEGKGIYKKDGSYPAPWFTTTKGQIFTYIKE